MGSRVDVCFFFGGGAGRLTQKRKCPDFRCPEVGISGNFTDIYLVAGNNCLHTKICKLSEFKYLAALVSIKTITARLTLCNNEKLNHGTTA